MKAARFVMVCGVVMGFACSANARLGETTEQVETRYGKPLKTFTVKEGMSSIYETNGFKIVVQFRNKKSSAEKYSHKDRKLYWNEIDAFLQAHSDGKKWIESDTQESIIRRWHREGGVTADISGVVGGNTAAYFTVTDGGKAQREGDAEMQKKVKPPSGF